MRDEMDGRIWTAHHDGLWQALDEGAARLGAMLRHIPLVAARQVILAAAAVGMTFLTLGGSVA